MIEKLTKRRVQVETMLWDGTVDRADEIAAWVRDPGGERFLTARQIPRIDGHARLFVAHNGDWCMLPIGYRVARELDGSGFYPLSPEGAAAGYEMPGAVEGSTPIASPAPADEPAPVPPPVDALLKGVEENTSAVKALIDLVNDYGVQAHAFGLGDAGASNTMTEVWREINDKIRTLWAAGVEEGRRQLVPQDAYEAGIYDAGIAEGRRQATEERTEEQTRDEEWGLRYKVNGLQREAGDGGHVFSDRDEAELHITTWRQHYPGLTYSDVEYMRRETFTGPWVADHG